MNLYDVFESKAHELPDHAAIVGPAAGEQLSYSELRRAVTAAATVLSRAGVRAGHCVALHVASGAEYIILNYAIWRSGGCVVPIPTELAAPEKQQICRQIAIDYVITSRRGRAFLEPFQRGQPETLGPDAVLVPICRLRTHPVGFASIPAAFIRFTSGTTGTCKGVVLSHRTIYDRIHAANDALRITPHDRVLWVLSMSYHFAVSIVAYLSFGATIVLPANSLAHAIFSATDRYRATLIYASPIHYAWMSDCDAAPALDSVRLGVSTTAPLDAATARRFKERFRLPLTQALGIIEIGLPCINTDFAERSESVGRVLPAYSLRLDDVGLGPDLKEILFRGAGFLDAYYEPFRTRQEIMPDGWFHTGDLGQLDADGCLTIRARLKDVISVMGMKFFPQEIESVLRSHPGVADASVFSRRDARLGEVPHARVVARRDTDQRPTEVELREHCAGQLAPYKVPQQIEFVHELPRTGSGKALHRELLPCEPIRRA